METHLNNDTNESPNFLRRNIYPSGRFLCLAYLLVLLAIREVSDSGQRSNK